MRLEEYLGDYQLIAKNEISKAILENKPIEQIIKENRSRRSTVLIIDQLTHEPVKDVYINTKKNKAILEKKILK